MLLILKICRKASLFLAVILMSCGGNDSSTDQNIESEQTTPREVNVVIHEPEEFLPFIHEVITLDSLELLKNLCHPDVSRIRFNNAHTVCNIRSDDMVEIDKFLHWFSNASVDGEIRTAGDTTWIPLQLGNGERHPVAILEKENDRYYLTGFEWKQ